MGMNVDIEFLEYSKILRQRWWIIVLVGLVGGLLGLLFSLANPPIYAARSVLIVGIDYTSSDSKSWTDTKIDTVNNKSALIVNSKGIIDQLISESKANGIIIRADAFSIDRRISKWELVVENSDPKVAADLANRWMDLSLAELQDARDHSLKVLEISSELSILNNCSTDVTPNAFCSRITNNLQLKDEISTLVKEMNIEEIGSKSVTPAFTFEKDRVADVPTQPAIFDRNILN